MKVNFIQQIKQAIADNQPDTINILVNNLLGGSDGEFLNPPSWGCHTDKLWNNFVIENTQIFNFPLYYGNTFSKDVLQLINGYKDDISFIVISCTETTSNKVPTPIRFLLTINGVSYGYLSNFNIINCRGIGAITSMVVSDVVVPTDYNGLLSIIVGSKNTYVS